MRDIYNREKKLETWTKKIKIELEECDRADAFMFVEYKREAGYMRLAYILLQPYILQ